jgi:cytochrome c556
MSGVGTGFWAILQFALASWQVGNLPYSNFGEPSMNRKLRILVAGLALLVSVPSLSGDDKESTKVGKLMRKKLDNAQKVLEGLALEDYDKIIKHSEELMDISKAVEWHVHKTPQYEVRSNEFRRALETLIEKAKEKNLDGVSLSYVEMTLSCVKCHKYVRKIGMGRLDSPIKTDDALTGISLRDR